jgi:hypothetical protein
MCTKEETYYIYSIFIPVNQFHLLRKGETIKYITFLVVQDQTEIKLHGRISIFHYYENEFNRYGCVDGESHRLPAGFELLLN